MTPDIWTHALRLFAATAIGCVLGLTRDVAGKPAGMRTMGLVALGAALITLCGLDASAGFGDDALAAALGVACGLGGWAVGALEKRSGQRAQNDQEIGS